MIEFRKSWPDERERAFRVYGAPVAESDQCFLAVASEPTERIIGAAFWSVDKGDGETSGMVSFVWKMLPAYVGRSEEQNFLSALFAEVSSIHPGVVLKTRNMLSAEDPAVGMLQATGFRVASTNVVFEGTSDSLLTGHERLAKSFQRLETESVLAKSPDATCLEELRSMVCQRHRLLSPEDLELPLKTPGAPNGVWDPEWSTVLIEPDSGRVLGAHLVKHRGEVMTVPVIVIESDNPMVPGEGWHRIAGRWLELCRERGWSGRFYCRINPEANRVMFRLAGLFGFREVGRLSSLMIG